MQRILCKSKIHRATVTDANLHYEGSITVDRRLMQLADLVPYEQVLVVDINNGSRAETYVIPGGPGSGEICINGALARQVQPGDLVIIMSFASYNETEVQNFKPNVILVDAHNKPVLDS